MHADLWSMAFVFVLATFVGFQVIQNVSRLLHTPLDVPDERDLCHCGRRFDHHRR